MVRGCVPLCRRWLVATGLLLFVLVSFSLPANAQEDDGLPTIAAKTEGMGLLSGFLNFYVDEEAGKIWLRLPAPEGERDLCREVLYVHGLIQGLGSNPVGLDRGQVSSGQILHFRRIGPRVLLEAPNLMYRAESNNPDERKAVQQSFATSVLWGAEVAAVDPDGASLVDFTSFLLRDGHGVVSTLSYTNQGSFSLNRDRSAVELGGCLAFPENVVFESTLTFTGDKPGGHVRSTTPTPEAVTVRAHYGFLKLPDDGYRPRRFDARIGVFAESYMDYAVPIASSLEKKWVVRYRLEKVDPTAERSPAREPIVFYVDRGAPEPIRSALVDGAAWWAEAFEAAGFEDAYRVEVLPEGVNPLDARYNVIQWVHRSTRGWSYGGGVSDPRTGEMIKGHVNLGSLRVRQDRRIFEALAGADASGSGSPNDPVQIALARIRQLSAHEVGHSLGMAHNFAASTYDDRASVMDYPAPLVSVGQNGALDFSKAYGVGIGTWDKLCVRYAYTQFPPGVDEEQALSAIVDEALENHLFVADSDARSTRNSDPRGNLWDNGADPVEELRAIMEVRARGIANFGIQNVQTGRPLAELEETFAPLYFLHRFQVQAAAKVVGGMEYNYAHRGDGQWTTRMVSADRQREALAAVTGLLSPRVLDIPEKILEVLVPRPFGSYRNREMFASSTSPAFDALGAAGTATDQVVGLLLDRARLGRVYDFHRRDSRMPSVREVLDELIGQVMTARGSGGRERAVQNVIRRATIDRMIEVAGQENLAPHLRAEIEAALEVVLSRMGESSQELSLAGDIQRFLSREVTTSGDLKNPAPLPPGSPIGNGGPY
ncbi:MAG: DUF5117 domain-containing protein, partial [Candidatus Eisenbacteria bacterium]|nr:DUF5117 domain-containing protein [Candidatus Eisenbacteria bacterium]